MAMKTRLKLILKAGNTVVAESADPLLWQSVLAAITGTGPADERDLPTPIAEQTRTADSEGPFLPSPELRSFCRMVQVPPERTHQAMQPTRQPPFLLLDEGRFRTFRDHHPQRGPNAISPSVLVSTLMVLWFKFAKLGSPTVYQVKQVLEPLGVTDRNAYRSVQNCRWLQLRDGRVQLHTLHTAERFRLARAFIETTSVYTTE